MSASKKSALNEKLYPHPFSAGYWRDAAAVFTQPKMLVLAAVVTALRIAVKSLSLPVGENLYVTFGFFFNALGSMIYGPLMGLLAGAVSDTLGAVLFPTGPYFFPFIFSEMLGSLIFALFLWRAKLSAWRIIASRFLVTVLVNLVVDPLIMIWYNRLLYDKPYTFFTLPRMVKNAALFPIQAVLLTVFLSALLPFLRRSGLVSREQPRLELERKHYISITLMAIISAAALILYGYYLSQTK